MTEKAIETAGEVAYPPEPRPPSPEGSTAANPSGETINVTSPLTLALARAQGQFKPVKMSGANSHFNSRYATLNDGIEAIRAALSSNQLAFTHTQRLEDGVLWSICTLRHSTGETLEGPWPIIEFPVKVGQQQIASANTYARRNSLFNLVGIAGDPDDDGNAAEAAGESFEMGPDEIAYVEQLVRDTESELAKVLHSVGGAPSVAEMNGEQYKKAIAWLNEKKRRAGGSKK